jgi:hypothetical protein
MDIDLVTPEGEIPWAQDPCPWNTADGVKDHRCAVKSTSMCPYFLGIEIEDTVLCSYPSLAR